MTATGGRRRALLGGLCGLAAVLLPLGVDHLASARLQRATMRILESRLGGQVTLRRVSLVGPNALRVEGLVIQWPGPGTSQLKAARVDIRLALASLARFRPVLSELRLKQGDFRWERPEALRSLRVLVARARGRSLAPSGRAHRTSQGVALDIQMGSVVIRELRSGTSPGSPHNDASRGPDHVEAHAITLRRASDGRWQGRMGNALAGLSVGARVEIGELSARGRERQGKPGMRVHWVRVGSGRWLPPGGVPTKAFRLVADELAPDLLQIRLEAEGTETVRLQADLDTHKRTVRSRLATTSLTLGNLYPWPSPAGLGLRDTLLTGSADFQASAVRQAVLQSRAQISHLVLRHRRVAPQPVPLRPLAVEGVLRVDGDRLTLENGVLVSGGVALRLEGALSRGAAAGEHGTTARLHLTLPPTGCAELLGALPKELAPRLQGMKLTGTLGGNIQLAVNSRALGDLTLRTAFEPSACQVLADPPGADVASLRQPFTFVIRPPGWAPTPLVMGPQNPDWVPYTSLGRNVIGAFLAAEDRNFFEHRGFDLENIRRALVEDLRVRGFAKGASSISQQVAKNVFLDHGRNLSRKLEEAIFTWRLEAVLHKQRILEIYLNLVEMGPGIFGVRAAARHYFQREPRNLDPLQAAHLAAITPHPRASHARFRQGRAGMDWLLHLRWLLFQMHRLGWVDRATYDQYRLRDLRLISY